MTALPPSSDITGATRKQSEAKTWLTSVRDYLGALFGAAGDLQTARQTLGVPFSNVEAKSAVYTVVAADHGKHFSCSNTMTLSLTAAATLGASFMFSYANDGSGVLTIDPNGSELIDGAATLTAAAGEEGVVLCDATGFRTIFKTVPPATELTGTGKDYWGNALPSGYIWASGSTIGDASSGATERANADTAALFTLLWNSFADAELPVSGGRGVSAAADFAAHKTIQVPDKRGRVSVGKDNMGGTSANRVTSGGAGIAGGTLGTSGGTETHSLTAAQNGVHSHANTATTTADAVVINGLYSTDSKNGSRPAMESLSDGAVSINNANSGSGSPHQNMQPSIICNYIIKL